MIANLSTTHKYLNSSSGYYCLLLNLSGDSRQDLKNDCSWSGSFPLGVLLLLFPLLLQRRKSFPSDLLFHVRGGVVMTVAWFANSMEGVSSFPVNQ